MLDVIAEMGDGMLAGPRYGYAVRTHKHTHRHRPNPGPAATHTHAQASAEPRARGSAATVGRGMVGHSVCRFGRSLALAALLVARSPRACRGECREAQREARGAACCARVQVPAQRVPHDHRAHVRSHALLRAARFCRRERRHPCRDAGAQPPPSLSHSPFFVFSPPTPSDVGRCASSSASSSSPSPSSSKYVDLLSDQLTYY
jgi:hypothetical protein